MSPLEPHPNDPAGAAPQDPATGARLPAPCLTRVYRLEANLGEPLLYVQSRSTRHGSAEVLARLGRGEHVGAGEYTFRASTQIETAAPQLDWLNKGIFISVGGRQTGAVIYETYLVG